MGLNPNEGMVYIAFPGSENMVNVKADVKSFLRRVTIGGRQVRVHSGWYGAYERMRENILKTVVPMVLENPEFSVMSIGYSYGCPISVFTALDLIYQQNVSASRVHLTNFGCPRIGLYFFVLTKFFFFLKFAFNIYTGNYDFARLVDQYSGISSVRRVIQTNDLVPRINSQALGYRHIGREYWLNSEADQMHFCNDDALGVHHAGATWVYDESPSCHNSLWLVTLSLNAHVREIVLLLTAELNNSFINFNLLHSSKSVIKRNGKSISSYVSVVRSSSYCSSQYSSVPATSKYPTRSFNLR